MLLREASNQSFADFLRAVFLHVEAAGENDTNYSLNQIVQSPHAKKYRRADSRVLYRTWELSPEELGKLKAGESLRFKSTLPAISFSWSHAAAEAFVTSHYFYPHTADKIGVMVRKNLRSQSDVLFNVESFITWFREYSERKQITEFPFPNPAPFAPKGNAPVDEFLEFEYEEEVLVAAKQYYLTLAPAEVVKVFE